MNQLEQVRKMCMDIVSKHVNAGVMRSVEATTRANTAKLIAAEIAALELPTPSYKQYGYAVLLRSEINDPLPVFDSIWSEYTVAQDHIKQQIQMLLDAGASSEECDLVAVPVYMQSNQAAETIDSHKIHEPLTDTPAAYCIYAENGNVRMWSGTEETVKALAEKEGLEITPLYKRPMPAQEPMNRKYCKTCASFRNGETCHKCGGETFIPHRSSTEPALPPIDIIRQLAKEVGYAIGVHGTQERDLDVIAAPWTETAVGNWDLMQHIAKGLSAVIVDKERKPLGRYAATIQMNGWYKQLDISVCPIPQPSKLASAEGSQL